MSKYLTTIERTSLGSLLTRCNNEDVLAQAIVKHLQSTNKLEGFSDKYVHQPVMDRTAIIDKLVFSYIRKNPGIKVLNLGCGFCTRFLRKPEDVDVEWVDADLNDVIRLKEEFLNTHSPTLKNYKLAVLDAHKTEIVNKLDHDLLLCEGMVSFIPEKTAKKLIDRYTIFDAISLKRKSAMGNDQLWKYDPNNWTHLNIISEHEFDTDSKRGAVILEVDQRGLAAS